MTEPKLFISYSWSSPEHEAWVVKVGTELRECAIDVILDKWDLREGNDAIAFMEQMVTDASIKKVILVCDRTYVEKTDRRAGGVGTEAQIISPEVYARADQTKFVAVVAQRAEDGRPYLPAYYRSRIYVDLSDEATYAQGFEQLVRWVYDKPFYQKPDLGTVPKFLQDTNGPTLGTAARFRRATEALRNGRDYADAAGSEYLTALADGVELLRITDVPDPFDEAVIKSIETFVPYRNEFIEFLTTVAIYRDTEAMRTTIHRFFERLIYYFYPPKGTSSSRDWDFDNFQFIVHELFLYTVAVLLRHERFESAAYLLTSEYYVSSVTLGGREGGMRPFSVFRNHMRSLQHRNDRLKLNRLSLRADLLEQRSHALPAGLSDLMQADFTMFLRASSGQPDERIPWWPETLMYASRQQGPFEIFARSRSASYLGRVLPVLGLSTKAELESLVQSFEVRERVIPVWSFESFNPRYLLGFEKIATRP
jgi:hypothetical protein